MKDKRKTEIMRSHAQRVCWWKEEWGMLTVKTELKHLLQLCLYLCQPCSPAENEEMTAANGVVWKEPAVLPAEKMQLRPECKMSLSIVNKEGSGCLQQKNIFWLIQWVFCHILEIASHHNELLAATATQPLTIEPVYWDCRVFPRVWDASPSGCSNAEMLMLAHQWGKVYCTKEMPQAPMCTYGDSCYILLGAVFARSCWLWAVCEQPAGLVVRLGSSLRASLV